MPIDAPTIEIAFSFDGDGYVACIRSAATRQPIVTLNLPRAAVDRAVLDAAQARLEVRLDGMVAAYLDADSRTLIRMKLSELVVAAVSVDALAAEDDSALISRLETELEQALDVVRQART